MDRWRATKEALIEGAATQGVRKDGAIMAEVHEVCINSPP